VSLVRYLYVILLKSGYPTLDRRWIFPQATDDV